MLIKSNFLKYFNIWKLKDSFIKWMNFGLAVWPVLYHNCIHQMQTPPSGHPGTEKLILCFKEKGRKCSENLVFNPKAVSYWHKKSCVSNIWNWEEEWRSGGAVMIFVFQDADRTDSLFPQLRSPVNQPSAAHLLQDQKTWLQCQASLLRREGGRGWREGGTTASLGLASRSGHSRITRR